MSPGRRRAQSRYLIFDWRGTLKCYDLGNPAVCLIVQSSHNALCDGASSIPVGMLSPPGHVIVKARLLSRLATEASHWHSARSASKHLFPSLTPRSGVAFELHQLVVADLPKTVGRAVAKVLDQEPSCTAVGIALREAASVSRPDSPVAKLIKPSVGRCLLARPVPHLTVVVRVAGRELDGRAVRIAGRAKAQARILHRSDDSGNADDAPALRL